LELLFFLVWKCTEVFDSHVSKELVKLDIEEIVVLMESAEALHKKVEATKKMVMEKIQNQAPFIPPSTPSVTTSTTKPSDEARKVAQASSGVGLIPVETGALLPLQIRNGVFQNGKFPTFRKGTGFFDVSLLSSQR
jgi:hypothetical protein